MILRDLLDEVRFGNTSHLCVAIHGDDNFLANYDAGKYWELTCGNWHEGSSSEAAPTIPEVIMNSEVLEVDASPNLRDIYFNLGKLYGKSSDTTVILVEAPDESVFDAEAYWSENDKNWPTVPMNEDCFHEWAYNITKSKWDEILAMEDDNYKLSMAVGNIPYIGIDTLKKYPDEDIEALAKENPSNADILRLARDIARKISNLAEMAALLHLQGFDSAFKNHL